ncbi:pleckstrin homology domain-containing family G member 3 [Lampris incognitus]|uniref:pleckstrin homology domain-containing family G member 3 n=1 Tax=Lampris incognitus TaxID=2546036 RepID=UPI0024B4964D|nr:pleckstrin homology domain-containing family G member 3 [Lampris incognitus]
MPEGSCSTFHQDPMGEESPQLCSPLSTSEHDQTEVDPGLYCYSQLCVEPLDGVGERPVSLVSTLSSGSSRDSHSIYGSTAAFPSSSTPPVPGEEDIDLELTPAVGVGEPAGEHSPTLRVSRDPWREQQEPHVVSNQRNNNNATASSWKSHTPSSPVATHAMAPNPKLTYVDRVVMEIIETERMYVRDLRSIVEDYLAHIIDTGDLPIQPEQVCALFGNIEDIYEFNSELLQSLDMCENDPVAVAKCFVDKSEYFEIYTQYCTNYPNSVAALTDCMRSKTLAKFFRERQAALKRSLPLGSYLLKPVQRILKYHLLLQEIAKHFDPEEDGYEMVQEAIDTMTGVAWYINDMKRKHEHAVRLQEIQSLLINWKGPDLTTYGELVLEGTFHVQRAKNTRTLFLFEKMLLITKKRGDHYIYKTHISCSTLMLLDGAKDPLLFSVIHFKHPKQPHTVQAKSVEEKRLWAHHIKRLILENHHTIIPQKAKDTILEMDSNYPGKYRYSPERLKKAESCQAEDFPVGGRSGRRRSEPTKQIIGTAKAVLKHADSEGALQEDRCSFQPASSVSTLASSVGKPQAKGPCEKEDFGGLNPRIDSMEQQSPCNTDPKLGSPACEGGLEKADEAMEEEGESYKEDILMGDDQDYQDINAAEVEASLREDVQTSTQEEEPSDMPAKKALTSQVNVENVTTLDFAPQEENNRQQDKHHSQDADCPALTLASPRPPETEEMSSRTAVEEEEEQKNDSSGLQVEEISILTNGEFSEEEEEVVSDSKSILPSSVLDQASVIAEHFSSSLSRRSSLVSEDLCSLACPSPQLSSPAFDNPSICLEGQENIQVSDNPSPVPQLPSETIISTPGYELGLNPLTEVEHRSTLSKQDRLLIHKVRRYYEYAEHQDANFSIKRRESLSYIPAGLVRHLSKQLTKIPKDHVIPVHRKGSFYNRPTSWSVFDLPGLENNQRAEPYHRLEKQRSLEAKACTQSVSNASTADEVFRPSSDMLKVWQGMEMDLHSSRGEKQEVLLTGGGSHDSRLHVTQKGQISTDILHVKNKEPLRILKESDVGTVAEESSTSPPITSSLVKDGESMQDSQLTKIPKRGRVARAPRPRIISLRSSMEEDQILQDMGRMKNKVFQLARQYSQRIKNNRPVIRQRNQESENHQSPKIISPVYEEKTQWRDNGKPNLTLPLNAYDQVSIHELHSPSSANTPSSGATSPCPVLTPCLNTPVQSEIFHWPDVQELRSKYNHTRQNRGAPHHSKVGRSCSMPERMLECCTEGWKSNSYSTGCSGSSEPLKTLTDSPHVQSDTERQYWSPVGEGRLLPQSEPPSLLCRWSSLDHVLGPLPLHEVQNLQEPVRTCYIAGQATLPNENKVIIVERIPEAMTGNEGQPAEQQQMQRGNGKLKDRGTLFYEDLDCAKKSAASSSGKKTESNLVKNLREKFQSLSSNS